MKNHRKGVITFEWMLLFTVLVIGIVGGVAVIRDVLIIESAETGDAILHCNQGYFIAPSLEVTMEVPAKGVYDLQGNLIGSDEIFYSTPGYAGGSEYIEARNEVYTSHVTITVPEPVYPQESEADPPADPTDPPEEDPTDPTDPIDP